MMVWDTIELRRMATHYWVRAVKRVGICIGREEPNVHICVRENVNIKKKNIKLDNNLTNDIFLLPTIKFYICMTFSMSLNG